MTGILRASALAISTHTIPLFRAGTCLELGYPGATDKNQHHVASRDLAVEPVGPRNPKGDIPIDVHENVRLWQLGLQPLVQAVCPGLGV